MSARVIYLLVLCLGGTLAAPSTKVPEESKIDFLMPNVQPKVADTYLCISMKANTTPTYIVGFAPHANMEIAHHILLYGCQEPGSKKQPWNCGEMAHLSSDYNTGPVCRSGAQILYAWAMDAPSLKLPEGVGFTVGGSTDVKYLVMQVHYKSVDTFLPPNNKTDSSGITMTTTNTEMPRRAGVYLLGTSGIIPSHSTVYMETACNFDEDVVLHPFAFRTHTHSLGKVVSGYVIHDGQWREIGRQDPHKPQMFYNATTPGLEIKKGDILAARCTMQNDKDVDVSIGSTQNDEMCNFYIMYYTDGDRISDQTYCFTPGPTTWYWDQFERADKMNLAAIPRTASIIPGTDKVIKQKIPRSIYDLYGDGARDELLPADYSWEALSDNADEIYDNLSDNDAELLAYLKNKLNNY
ncbi:hypothetical protein CHS0354_020042 [Potamilus streckersoni]|uniref:peptidylglycine monooxygenase n=1 Tax=Potamilus streckersoni TaxID=2493646 RepID=A0AAE0S7M1_9BIVA|nr:hypothetical protein CHS0354_020042 [Potamilus streckersoni]